MNQLKRIKFKLFFLVCSHILLLMGCQPQVYLMPPPIGLQPGTNYFNLSRNNKENNRLSTFYATNRIPNTFSHHNDGYTIFPSDDLRLGIVTHQVGTNDDSWKVFYDKSLSKERNEDLLISLQGIDEFLTIEDNQPLDTITSGENSFIDLINRELANNADKDITLYVHGANSNFYRATAQGAQYFHYTGHNSVVITYSWPSAENIFKYKVDVLHAEKTVPAFARLLQFLAQNTTARNINIISYSAGAQVVAPALVHLRNSLSHLDEQVIKENYRIGEVYLAAPDIEFQSFANRLKQFINIVERITISANMSDSVLLHAQRYTGKSRLGRPIAKEATTIERELLTASSLTKNLDILDIEGSHSLQVGTSHNFWYNHPWVSNDLLLLMLLNLSPKERGLIGTLHKGGMKIWHFPENYEQKIRVLIEKLKKNQPTNNYSQ